ncbi:hypothetical protein V502_03130, partial [Pseudogymnoascus sp. VKM F-4520 (FW-2644)]
ITSVIWQSGKTIELASIVFVTPESVLQKGFWDFVRLLQDTHRLDRIFIDKCHTVLASSATFWPTMQHLVSEEQLKIKYPALAKIIVYSQEIKEAKKLSKALGTMLYHAKVDNWSGKDKRLSKWKSGNEESWVVVASKEWKSRNEESWVAVASKALGLGVNTRDTRAVVHAGMPQDLADYVQESGQAGRDGLPSEAIVLLPEESAKH